ncbi:MAG: DUF6448 family protein [Bacteroidota bacterium]
MQHRSFHRTLGVATLLAAALLLGSSTSFAHCDTMNGPVVIAAQKALDSGNVNLVLIWVQKKDEAEIRESFNKTLAVRKLGPEAKKLADMYFFETLVRIHRAGEGAPYTGLKAAGSEVEPGVEMADRAVEKGSADELLQHLSKAVQQKVSASFNEVKASKNFKADDVEGGRKFVSSYVTFIHYVEGIHNAVARGGAHGHGATTVESHKEQGH